MMEDNKRELIYKVGDILEFDANVKGLVACIYSRAAHSEFLYGIWTWDGEVADCDEWLESDLITQAKRVDHMDISLLFGGKEKKEKEKNECNAKEALDKINSALSTLIGYDDLVLRVKVDDNQVKHMKIGEDTIEFEAVDKNIRELQKENEKLKNEIETLKEALDHQKHDNDIWKQGWFECLKSLCYYLNS